jgi:sigma-B regulation protein RsbU (phosphoserine phosphatase)
LACEVILRDRRLIDTEVAVSSHTDLPGVPRAVAEARRFVSAQLSGSLAADALATALLLTSELVTNVVLHARTPVHLGVTRDGESLLVTVADSNPAGPQERAASLELEQLPESGRGLHIIEALADDFGWSRAPEGGGKVSWFVLALPPPPRVPLQEGQEDAAPAGGS